MRSLKRDFSSQESPSQYWGCFLTICLLFAHNCLVFVSTCSLFAAMLMNMGFHSRVLYQTQTNCYLNYLEWHRAIRNLSVTIGIRPETGRNPAGNRLESGIRPETGRNPALKRFFIVCVAPWAKKMIKIWFRMGTNTNHKKS